MREQWQQSFLSLILFWPSDYNACSGGNHWNSVKGSKVRNNDDTCHAPCVLHTRFPSERHEPRETAKTVCSVDHVLRRTGFLGRALGRTSAVDAHEQLPEQGRDFFGTDRTAPPSQDHELSGRVELCGSRFSDG